MISENVPSVAIIGGGFCGIMTAINLIEKANQPINISLINDDFPTAKGVAFSAHTSAYLLNVPASNMSCFADDLRHFLRWLQQKELYKILPENILERIFVPRELYGEYLYQTWQELKNSNPQVKVKEINDKACDIKVDGNKAIVYLKNKNFVEADFVILATGNEKPSDIRILDTSFYNSPNYYANPWKADAVEVSENDPVLIIGNGLTMVDTVLGLQERNYKGTIYSLSPNGFSLLPHVCNGVLYKELLNELKPPYNLSQLFSLFKKHIKTVSNIGLTAEPVIDSIRVKTQELWSELSIDEKRRFLRHIKYKWGIARHRIPAHIHRRLQQLRINKDLVCFKASLLNIKETEGGVAVFFYNKETKQEEQITVGRVINCTGPECNISKSNNELIHNLVRNNLISPDPLRLGINATFDGAIINVDGTISDVLFTLGAHMKGILWESTSVPDLRVQAERLSILLLRKINRLWGNEVTSKMHPFQIKTKTVQSVKEEELIEFYI